MTLCIELVIKKARASSIRESARNISAEKIFAHIETALFFDLERRMIAAKMRAIAIVRVIKP